jgi:hypothetical protein
MSPLSEPNFHVMNYMWGKPTSGGKQKSDIDLLRSLAGEIHRDMFARWVAQNVHLERIESWADDKEVFGIRLWWSLLRDLPIAGHMHGIKGIPSRPSQSLDGPFTIDGVRIWYDDVVRKISLHIDGQWWYDIGDYKIEGPNYIEASDLGNVFGFQCQEAPLGLNRFGVFSTDYGTLSIAGFHREVLPKQDTFRLLGFEHTSPTSMDLKLTFNHPVDIKTLVAPMTCIVDIGNPQMKRLFRALAGKFEYGDAPNIVIFKNTLNSDLVYPDGEGIASVAVRMGGVRDRAGALLDGKSIGISGGVFYRRELYQRMKFELEGAKLLPPRGSGSWGMPPDEPGFTEITDFVKRVDAK